jgi:hypothetical protein
MFYDCDHPAWTVWQLGMRFGRSSATSSSPT